MRFNALDLTANATTLLYTCPAGHEAFVTVSLTNRSSAKVQVQLALTVAAVPTDADWIEFDTPLPPKGTSGGSTLVRSELPLAAGERLYVRSDAAGVSAVAYGYREAV